MASPSKMKLAHTANFVLTRLTPVLIRPFFSSPSVMSFFFSRVQWPSSFFRMTLSPLSVLSSFATSDQMAAGSAGLPADCRCIMIKRIFKRIFVFAVIACLLFACVPSVAFADVVEFQEAAKLGATIVDLYGSVNNTSLAYDALNDGSALTVIQNLYSDYSSSSSDPYTLAAIGAAAAAAGTIAVVYDAITGKGYIQLYQTEYIESLDGFWDYTLSDLGLTRNLDGLFEWTIDQNGDVEPLQVYSLPGSFTGQPLPVYVSGMTNEQAFDASFKASPVIGIYNSQTGILAGSSDCYAFRFGNGTSGHRSIVVASLSNSVQRYQIESVNYSPYYYFSGGDDSVRSATYLGHLIYYVLWQSSSFSSMSYVPLYSNLDSALPDVYSILSGNPNPGLVSASVIAYPEYYIGDPLTAQPSITIPDPASPQYVPSPSRINTDIEWLPEWGDPLPDGVSEPVPGVPYPVTDPSILNDVVPEIWQSVVQGVQTDPGSDPDPDPDPDPGPNPSEVFTPLLPVTLPSFNFSFSGIWHYVREWVASLGAWFTTLFSIWSALPYAMVVPVYATAVVVIVLGVYKRFFM